MSIPISRNDIEDIKRSLDELNHDSGWHAPPSETYLKHSGGTATDQVISVRVVSGIEGAHLQVMTYAGEVHLVGPSNELINLAWS